MLDFERDKVVLLFFKNFEKDSFFRNDRYIKRVLRPIYSRILRKQSISGFEVWYQLLIKALRGAGYNVRLNDYRLAKLNPLYPVGLVGYPHLLDEWTLPNPAVLGPSLLDHPNQRADLMKNPKYKRYLVTCDWMHSLFAPIYGDKVADWRAGIDVDEWPDTKSPNKPVDVLIYDKIRWNRDSYTTSMLDPINKFLADKNLKVETIKYGSYQHKDYAHALARSKSMIFLCEHETQGMAYQEALISNVPILAWENGFWLDPRRPEYTPNPVPATSVPYFSDTCGEKFQDFTDFSASFERFWAKLGTYEPRAYIRNTLSFDESARLYIESYRAAVLFKSP
jgi:hypothetical protein